MYKRQRYIRKNLIENFIKNRIPIAACALKFSQCAKKKIIIPVVAVVGTVVTVLTVLTVGVVAVVADSVVNVVGLLVLSTTHTHAHAVLTVRADMGSVWTPCRHFPTNSVTY